MAHNLQIRRGEISQLPTLNPGELGVALDEERMFVGGSNQNIELATVKATDNLKNTLNKITEDVNKKADLVNGRVSNEQLPLMQIPIVTTSGTGSAYTVTIKEITDLTQGMLITIIPHTVSTVLSPTLSVNGSTPILITRQYGGATSGNSGGSLTSWISVNTPITLQYRGNQWSCMQVPIPTASDLTGTVAVRNGGTGRTSWEINKIVYPAASSTLGQLPFPTEDESLLMQDKTGAPYWLSSKDLKGTTSEGLQQPITTLVLEDVNKDGNLTDRLGNKIDPNIPYQLMFMHFSNISATPKECQLMLEGTDGEECWFAFHNPCLYTHLNELNKDDLIKTKTSLVYLDVEGMRAYVLNLYDKENHITNDEMHVTEEDKNRWNSIAGSGGTGVSLGETSYTAYRGDKGKIAYDHSQEAHAPLISQLPIVKTSGTSTAYLAAIDGITALTSGMTITVIPHIASTSISPTLNLNDLGAVGIRRHASAITGTSYMGHTTNWLTANTPITLQYNGTYWMMLNMSAPQAVDLVGTLPVANGGTGKSIWDTNKLVYPTADNALGQLPMPTKDKSFLMQDTSGAPYWEVPEILENGAKVTEEEKEKWNRGDILIGRTQAPTLEGFAAYTTNAPSTVGIEAGTMLMLRIGHGVACSTSGELQMKLNNLPYCTIKFRENNIKSISPFDRIMLFYDGTYWHCLSAPKSNYFGYNLLASKWIGNSAPYTYEVEHTYIRFGSAVIEMIPPPDITASTLRELQEANIVGGDQTDGKLILRAFGKKPVSNLYVYFIARSDT